MLKNNKSYSQPGSIRRQGRRGFGRDEIIMTTVLIVVIGLGLFVAFKQFFSSESDYKPMDVIYKCLNERCGEEYLAADLTDEERRSLTKGIPEEDNEPYLFCAKCGQRDAVRKDRCLKCEEYFVPQFLVDDTERPDDIECTECGTKQREEHNRRRRELHGD